MRLRNLGCLVYIALSAFYLVSLAVLLYVAVRIIKWAWA